MTASPKTTAYRNAALAFADQIITSGSNFLTGVIVGRALSIGDFGEFSLGMTLMIFSLVLQDTLLATPYTYHLHKEADHERRRGLRAGNMIQSLLLAIACGVLLIASRTIDFSGQAGNSFYAVVTSLGFSLPLIFLREGLRRQFFAEFRFLDAVKLDLLVSGAQFFLIFIFWMAKFLYPATVFAAMALAAGVGVVTALYHKRSDFDFKDMNVLRDTRANILYGRWLIAGSACHLGSLYTYPWFVYLMHGREEAGAFAACFAIINLFNPFVLGFNNYFRPKIIKARIDHGAEAMDAQVRRACMLLGLLALAASVFLWLFGGLLVNLVYGDEFTGLGTAIGFVGLSLLPVFFGAPLQLGTLALNKPQINPMFHATALAMTVLAGLPLALLYGKTGAAAGYSLATAAGCAVLATLYRRELGRAAATAED